MTAHDIREILRCILSGSESAFGKEIHCKDCRHKPSCDSISNHLNELKEGKHV